MNVLLRMAWRNLWRQRRRTWITASAMAIGVALTMAGLCLNDGMYELMADVMVRQRLGHVQVQHPDWPGREALHDTLRHLDRIEATIGRVEGVRGAAPRMFTWGLAATEDRAEGSRWVGIDLEREPAILDRTGQLRAGRLPRAPREAAVGVELARKLRLELGSELIFIAQAADGSMANDLFTVVGTLRTGDARFDGAGVLVGLHDLQDLLVLPDQAHELLVVGEGMDTPEDADALAARIREALASGVCQALGPDEAASPEGGPPCQVRSWRQADPQTAQMLAMQDAAAAIMMVIVYGVASLGILNTMLMAVFERTRELGVMRALGMARRRIMGLVLAEGVSLAAVAGTLGVALGGILDWYLVRYGLDYGSRDGKGFQFQGVSFDPHIKGAFHVEPVVVTVLVLALVAILAGLWPAWRAARLRPVDAMREA